MKLYVGMGLTQAPQDFREDFQCELKEGLRVLPDIELLDFIGLEAGTVSDVYKYDRHATESADLCLFVADHPSIGLGMEIAFRLCVKKPMFICAHTDAHVTRMLIGMCAEEDVELFRYSTTEDIVHKVTEYLA